MNGTEVPPENRPETRAHRTGQVVATRAIVSLLESLAQQFADPEAIRAAQPDLPEEVVSAMRAAVGGLYGSAIKLIQGGAHIPQADRRVVVKDRTGAEWVVAKE